MVATSPVIPINALTSYRCYAWGVWLDNVNVWPPASGCAAPQAINVEVGKPLLIDVDCVSIDYDALGNQIGGGPVFVTCRVYWDGNLVGSFSSSDTFSFTIPSKGSHGIVIQADLPCPNDSRCTISTCLTRV